MEKTPCELFYTLELTFSRDVVKKLETLESEDAAYERIENLRYAHGPGVYDFRVEKLA